MPDTKPVDIVSAARFVLAGDNFKPIEFSELTGISSEFDVVEFQDNDGNGHVQLHKLPGKQKPATIGLKRPMNSVMDLWVWHNELQLPGGYNAARRSGTLTMYDFEGSAVAEQAQPRRAEGGRQ